MKKLVLIPLVAAAIIFGSPFTSAAFAETVNAAVICTCMDQVGIDCVHTIAGTICIHDKNPTSDCVNAM